MCISAPVSPILSLNDSSFLNKVAFHRTVISRIWDIISYPGFPIVVYQYSALLLSAHSIVIHLSALSPHCRSAQSCTALNLLAPSVLVKRIKRKDGSGGRENPGGLVINGLPTKEPSPAIQSLPSCLGEPVAVIQDSHVDPLLPQLPPLLLARSFILRGLPLLLAHDAASIGPYTAAPSKLVQTPDHWVNAMISAF